MNISQVELSDLTRDLGLLKDAAEFLGSRLKEKKLIGQRNRFLLVQESRKGICYVVLGGGGEPGLLFYIPGLMSNFNITYDKDKWRLFIHSSKRSLKAVLLYHGS